MQRQDNFQIERLIMAMIFDGQSSDGVSSAVDLSGPTTVVVSGPFDRSQLYLELAGEELVYVPLPKVQGDQDYFSAPGVCVIDAPGPCKLRARLAQANSGVTDVTVEVMS
jgi:hypothetical protein